MYSRREFGSLLIAGLPAATLLAQKVDGVQLGVCTYSFRSLPHAPAGDAVDAVIDSMKQCGADDCELFSPQLEPANPTGLGGPGPAPSRGGASPTPEARAAAMRARMNSPEAKKAREDLRQWRLNTSMDHFRAVKQTFDSAGINIFAYS